MAPVGNKALAKVNNNVYVVTIPTVGKVPSINVGDPASSNFPSRQLTEIGGEFPAWEANGKKIHWSLGNGHWVYDIDRAEFVEDSVKTAKKRQRLWPLRIVLPHLKPKAKTPLNWQIPWPKQIKKTH